MASTKQLNPLPARTDDARAWPGLHVTRSVLMIIGGIAAFLGAFIMFAGDDHYIGIGGDASWRVGDIDPAWGWTLLIGGALFLIVGVLIVVGYRRADRAMPVSNPRADVVAHTAVFVLVNALIWVQDFAIGGGLNYAWWITGPWAVWLAAHIATYLGSSRR